MNEELKSGLMVSCCVQPLEMEEKNLAYDKLETRRRERGPSRKL